MLLEELLKESLNSSVVDTFSTTINMKPIKKEANFMPSKADCIISSIGFRGALDGSFTICVPEESSCKIVSKMLYMDIEEVNYDVIDGIGELINMIAGGVKMRLVNTEYTFDISIPTVIKGNNLLVMDPSEKTTKVSLDYECDDISFSIVLIFQLSESKTTFKRPDANTQTNKNDTLDALNKVIGDSQTTKQNDATKALSDSINNSQSQGATGSEEKNATEKLNDTLKKFKLE